MVRKGTLKEISFASLAGDDRTSATIAASQKTNQIEVIAMLFDAWLKAKGWDAEKLSEAQVVTLKAAWKAESKADPPSGTARDPADPPVIESVIEAVDKPADLVAAANKLMAENTTRVNEIRKICAKYDNPTIEVDGEKLDLEAHAIEQNWTADKTELHALRDGRKKGPAIHAHSHDGDATLQAMQGAMLLRAGLRLDDEAFDTPQAVAIGLPRWMRAGINEDARQQIMESAHHFSDLSMLDICAESIRLDGQSLPRGRAAVLEAAFSGSALTKIFTTNVNAKVLTTYLEAGDTTAGWTTESEVGDFRSNERPRMTKGPDLKKLPRGKEADHVDRSDVAETYKIARYAKQFVVDEQDVIDDRFNALADTPREMGLAAARLRPDLVYSILLANANLDDNVALFHADHNNLNTSSALADATLKVAIADIEKQQENSVTLNLRASHLIVPSDLKHTAAGLIRSATTLKHGNTDTTFTTENTIASIESLELVSDGRLANGVTDPDAGTVHAGSATTWFLGSSMGHNIEVGFLRGTGRAPQIRSFVLSQGKWGIGWDVKMDIGAKSLDFHGLGKNTG